MSLTKSLKPGGRHGLSSQESRDPIGFAVAALNRVAQSDLIDRIGLRTPGRAGGLHGDPQRVPDR